ncbi:MAG: hypothetical protein M1815_000294 [Lichina confinis]|nr:MAG: hypothetical protein M1815_000294 [Lichina confinis]
MPIGGALLKTSQTLLRLVQLLGAILILAIYSYFLAVQAKYDLGQPNRVKAVEGIAGGAIIWAAFALLLTCFIGGLKGFGIPALILDLLFFGGFIAVTIMTRSGRHSCSGDVSTPLGSGNTDTGEFVSSPRSNYRPNLTRSCLLQKVVFAVAIILFVLFLVSAVVQILLVRHHKKEKRFGPSPANNYTKGSGARGLFRRKKRNTATSDAELATAGTVAPATDSHHHEKHNHHGVQPSQETGYTASNVAPGAGYSNASNTIHDPHQMAQYPEASGGVRY